MSKYKVTIKFTPKALKAIYAAGERLALTKEVVGNKGKSVTWVSTLPFESNVIEWEEDYLLYASRQETQAGAVISKLSEESAICGTMYSFEDGIFENAHTAECVGKNEYGLQNCMDMYPYLSFGLAQPVRVNDEFQAGNPINVLTVPYNHMAVMSPREKIKIFLAADLDNGVVISREFSNSLEVEYIGTDTEKTVVYDYESGMFVPA